MTPIMALQDSKNHIMAYTILSGYLDAGKSLMGIVLRCPSQATNFFHLFLCQFSLVVAGAYQIVTMAVLRSVLNIAFWSYPFQILKMIIQAVAVLVISYIALWGRANKSHKYQAVNTIWPTIQSHRKVVIPVGGFQDFVPSQRKNTTEGTHHVIGMLCYLSPIFLYHTFIIAQKVNYGNN